MIKRTYILIITILAVICPQDSEGQPTIASGELHIVEGRLTGQNGEPAVNKIVYLTIAAPRYELRTAVTDNHGNIRFAVPGVGAKGQFVFQYNHRLDSNLIFTTEKDFLRPYTTIQPEQTGYLYQDTSFFYGTPDRSYVLDDYTRFGTLEEVFREFVAEVRLSKQGENYRLSVINKPFKLFFDNEPLVLIDGVPVFDHNRLMQLDPVRIRSIDVVARRYYLGSLMCNGIVCLYSFDADMAGYTLPHRALVRDFVTGR